MEQDLNDLAFFAQVVEKGGFAAAGRALGVPKSRLSRRIAQLEERLGVRLLQRSSRRFAITEIGQVYLRHCQAILDEAQAAQEAIDQVHAEPRGQVRLSCPITVAQTMLSPLVSEFMQAHPHVTMHMDVTNRRVDVIEEGFDLAIRVRPVLENSNLVMRTFALTRATLLGTCALLERLGPPRTPADLARFPSLSMPMRDGRYVWDLRDDNGNTVQVEHVPRLYADDLQVLRDAAAAGIGLAALPEYFCRTELESGRLVRALPGWKFPEATLHAVFASRRGLHPAVRAFIDFLALRLPEVASEIAFGDYVASTPARRAE